MIAPSVMPSARASAGQETSAITLTLIVFSSRSAERQSSNTCTECLLQMTWPMTTSPPRQWMRQVTPSMAW